MDGRMIRSAEDMGALALDCGFLPLLRGKIPGFSVQEHTPPERWFADDTDGPWEWKGPVLQATGCAYGKFFSGKAGFVSPDWYPDFANLRRGGAALDEQYERGLVRREDKLIYDTLGEYGTLLSKELKAFCGFGRDGRKGFDAALTRLQMRGFVITINFEYEVGADGKEYGWGLARVAAPELIFGEKFLPRRSPEKSRERVFAHLRKLLPTADERSIKRLVG